LQQALQNPGKIPAPAVKLQGGTFRAISDRQFFPLAIGPGHAKLLA
jgi:hypothetical protein